MSGSGGGEIGGGKDGFRLRPYEDRIRDMLCGPGALHQQREEIVIAIAREADREVATLRARLPRQI